jgi:hypothetical protein
MKVHSSLQKRPLVLFELLVCMGVLSSSTNYQANAIQLNHLATQGIFANHQLNINAMAQLSEEAEEPTEPVDASAT